MAALPDAAARRDSLSCFLLLMKKSHLHHPTFFFYFLQSNIISDISEVFPEKDYDEPPYTIVQTFNDEVNLLAKDGADHNCHSVPILREAQRRRQYTLLIQRMMVDIVKEGNFIQGKSSDCVCVCVRACE